MHHRCLGNAICHVGAVPLEKGPFRTCFFNLIWKQANRGCQAQFYDFATGAVVVTLAQPHYINYGSIAF
jgi:hypothetical protein